MNGVSGFVSRTDWLCIGGKGSRGKEAEWGTTEIGTHKCAHRYLEVVWLTIYSFPFIPFKESSDLLTNVFVYIISVFHSSQREWVWWGEERTAHSRIMLAWKASARFSSAAGEWWAGRRRGWNTSHLLLLSNMTLLLSKSVIKAKSNNRLAKPQRKTMIRETRELGWLEKVSSAWSIYLEERRLRKKAIVKSNLISHFQACFIL